MSDGGLEVTPTELRFRVEPRRQIPSALSLRNPGPNRMAFKVKTTAPKKYCVRPSNGFVEACATATIQVTMQAAKGMPPESEFENCKDKFLIQSVVCDMTEQAVSSAMFDKTTNPTGVREKKVKVVLEKPSVRLDQVSEDQEPEEANGRVGTLSATAGDTSSTAEVDTRAAKFDDLSKIISERTKLKKEVDKAKEERDMLKGQLDDLRMREIARDSGAVHDSANTLQASSMMQTWYAVLAALLCFVLGYFM